jgi:hypothetical protein
MVIFKQIDTAKHSCYSANTKQKELSMGLEPEIMQRIEELEPIEPRLFCRIWLGWADLPADELQKLESWGAKKVYSKLLAKILPGITERRLRGWSSGFDHDLEQSLNFPLMPVGYRYTLACRLKIKMLEERIEQQAQQNGSSLKRSQVCYSNNKGESKIWAGR